MFEAARDRANGIGDSFLASRAVGFEHKAIKAKHGRAAVRVGIEAAFDRVKSIASEQRAQLPMRAGGKLAFEHQKDAHGKALAGLQHDIADKTIANDNFDPAFEQ